MDLKYVRFDKLNIVKDTIIKLCCGKCKKFPIKVYTKEKEVRCYECKDENYERNFILEEITGSCEIECPRCGSSTVLYKFIIYI